LSGHGDSTQLLKLITQSMNQNKLKKVVIVHGGEEERQYMMEQLKLKMNMDKKEVMTLKEGETIRFF
jgi:predicted metal-dependent RNase